MKKIYHAFFSILLIGLMTSCEKGEVDIFTPEPKPKEIRDFIPWVIEKDFHNCTCTGYREFDLKDTLKFEFYFDASAFYNAKDLSNPSSWNKVIGFSDCGGHHHQNSLRLGWRVDPEEGIELAMYYYQDGQRNMDKIQNAHQRDTMDVKMWVTNTKYYIEIDGIRYSAPGRHCTNRPKTYMLYPYFGGNDKAPHDITIWFRFPEHYKF